MDTFEMDAPIIDINADDRKQILNYREDDDKNTPNDKANYNGCYLELEVLFLVGQTWDVESKTPAITIIKQPARNLRGINFFTSIMLIIIKFALMNNSNLNKAQNNQQVQSIQDADLRLQRTIELYQEAKQQLKFVESQCEQYQQLLLALKEEHQTLKKSFLFNKVNSFQSWQNRLTKIADKISSDQSIFDIQTKIQGGSKDKKISCNKKKHLQDIFQQQQIEQQRNKILKLEAKLRDLYAKIQNCLKEQCLNEKVMVRIKKQSKRAAKIKILQFMDKQASQYKGWLQDNKAKVNNQLQQKQLQQRVIDNLQGMKKLVNKKVINNDYIFDLFGDQSQSMLKIVDEMDKLGQFIKQKCDAYDKQTKQAYKNSYFSKKDHKRSLQQTHPKQQLSNITETVAEYFNNARQVISQVEFSQQHQILSYQCQKLKEKLDHIIKSCPK